MSKAHILVVDDEPGVRELVGDVLGLEGYETTLALDGLDALTQIRKKKFDLYVLDINSLKSMGWRCWRRCAMQGTKPQHFCLVLDAKGMTFILALGSEPMIM